MALRFIDNFINTNLTQATTEKWGYLHTTANVSIGSSIPRFPGTRYFDVQQSNGRYVQKDLDSQSTWVVGFAFYRGNSINAVNAITLLDIVDTGTVQISIRINLDNTFSVFRHTGSPSTGTVLETTTNVFQLQRWAYIEFKATINDTTGSYELRVNGSTWASGTNVDTQESGNSTANIIRLGGIDGTHNTNARYQFADVYICDGTGTTNNDFLGDVKVDTIYPNGNGNQSDFVGSDGNSVDNYLLVDDNPSSDGDTTYVQSATPNDIDLYTFGDLSSTTTTIFGIQPCLYSRKTDAGVRIVVPQLRTNATNYDIADQASLNGSYQYECSISEENPDTVSAYTASDINNAEFGVRVVS